ncbi:Protein F37C4.5 [Psilocybe cubensis]|uniref:Protein F37C4.5 n=2 Tax=Psilocybe cubensis TaxID=181762 RepID=A0ACB8GJ43_PSICU|nr:Protein F37C4.5 [Psilocybe cubensis]KAH9475070.1 Protein F37C4.5 [Psilocybe cubensis]
MHVITLHELSIDSIKDSKITNINLYTSRAHVTRSFNVNAAAGQTKITISNLPNCVDYDSLRVEGRGPAVIQGVAVAKAPIARPEISSPLFRDLDDRKARAENALQRCIKAKQAVEKYMGNISVEHMDISKLGEAMDVYDNTEEKWDLKIMELRKDIKDLEIQMDQEVQRLEMQVENKKLRTKVTLTIFTEIDAELEIILVYAVSNSYWHAGYDIRVDMQTKGAPVQVTYKAAINQRTGEKWENVPITLETSQPTFGVELPELKPWKITYEMPSSKRTRQTARKCTGGKAARRQVVSTPAEPDSDEDEDEDMMEFDVSTVTSKGNVNATFLVPGLTTVPSDQEEHGVTIAELLLEAEISWICIPQGSTQVHLQAKILNSSEYTFLPGPSNVYVDQSFISHSRIPGVASLETFSCPLGVDPSIRVTYHPQEKITSESGFYNKTVKHLYTQRISVYNSKSVAIKGLKVIDRIPVSEDAALVVNLINPALDLPGPETDVSNSLVSISPGVKVGDEIIAQWNRTESIGDDVSALGKDGQVCWICSVPALGRNNLVLQWEVIDSQKTKIFGLDS